MLSKLTSNFSFTHNSSLMNSSLSRSSRAC